MGEVGSSLRYWTEYEPAPQPVRVRDATIAIGAGSLMGSVVLLWLTAEHFGSLEAAAAVEFADYPVAPLLWSMAVTAAIEFAYVGYALSFRGHRVGEFLGVSFELEDAVLGIGVLVAHYTVAYVVLTWIVPGLGHGTDGVQSQFPSAFARATEPEILGFIVLVGIVIPVVEEILFRGVMLRALEDRMGLVLAVIVSSVVFGLAHIATFSEADIPVVAFATGAGLVFGSCAAYTGRIMPGMIAHAVNNVVVALAVTGG